MEETFYDPGFNDPFSPHLRWHSEEGRFEEGGVETAHREHDPVDEVSQAIVSMPEAPQVDAEEKNRGAEALIQTFYEGPARCRCCINWVEKPPTRIPDATQERYDQAAIRIYRKKGGDKTYGGVLGTRIAEIEIQSPIIVKIIQPLLADVGMPANPKRKGLLMSNPFKELYFAHSKIRSLVQQYGPGSDEREHLDILIQTLDELFVDASREVAQLNAEKRTTCGWLWTLFPKDMIVYARQDGQDRLYQVIDIDDDDRGQRKRVMCRYVLFDGVRFGSTRTVIYIPFFHGVISIKDLPVYPLGFHSDPKLEETLVKRGIRLLDYQEMEYREYSGVAKAAEEDEPAEYDARDELKSYRVNGRIVIDPFSFGKFEPGCANELEEIEPKRDDAGGGIDDKASIAATLRELSEGSRVGFRPSTEKQRSNSARIQTNRQCLCLMSPLLAGFSLRLKKWLWFSIDNIRPISWNEEAYDHLVFPESRKDLVRTFVSNHGRSRASYTDDVIIGKGQGLVLLLSGPPGTGKTLTAEAVADKTRHPLYHLHAEELGTEAYEVGRRLSRTFDFATEWNAIILLDEADTFLAKRSVDSRARNEMVSAVLQHLEYYRGIIFLTTNLLESIDEAFLSRIHIHLRFPSLSFESRLTLWANFLNRLQFSDPSSMAQDGGMDIQPTDTCRADLTSEDLDALAQWNLNGREIKNVVKNAHLWCSYKGYDMTLDRLEDAIHVTTPFAGKVSVMPQT